MKAKEVLRGYAEGRRDFQFVNLRGQSFKGKDLSGADFSEADLRGANFKNAILRGTKFCKAKAGLQKRWATFLFLISLLLLLIASFFYAFIGYVVSLIFDTSNLDDQIGGWVALIVIIVFFFVTIRHGAVAVAGAGAVAGAVVVAVVGAGAGAVVVAVVGAGAGAVAVAGAGAVVVVVVGAGAGAGAVALLGAYLGWRAIKGDPRDAWIRTIAIAFAATGGTSFYNADLTDADLTDATLKNTDLRKANLTRTCWRDTIKLDLARPGQTILANTAVRELLISGNGYKKSYVDGNLRGANLRGANLNYAHLKLADISEANLREANLEWANLTETNCLGTDFTHSYFTGACLEGWNIESTTLLEQVDCRFVYLLEKTKNDQTDDRERRPSSGEFAPGEFTKLFQEVLNTVDLIFRYGVNWEAFIKAFDDVRNKVRVENEGTELNVQSIEDKGDNVFVIKVNVPPDADKEKIHSDITQTYERELKAIEDKYRLQLNAKENEIAIYRQQSANLREIIKLQASRPINFINEAKAMNQSTDQSRKIENRDGNIIGNILGDSGTISGTVAQTIGQLPDSPDPNTPRIKELLGQLQAAIADETSLEDDDKAEALEQVGTLAEAGQNPNDGVMKKAAKTAMKILRGTVASLPTATKLVSECNKLLPEIAKIFGLG